MLERMEAFFAARLAGYDAHMLAEIEGAREFYPFTAALLPRQREERILDLGCGTGLELEAYYAQGGQAAVTGIDLSADMLDALRRKLPGQALTLICGSYFDVPLGEGAFDAAVSVESLHHFPAAQKLGLYRRLHAALKPGGFFVLTDYFAESEALEAEYFENLRALKAEQGLPENEFFHYDTPLTLAHETDALLRAGFSRVECLNTWNATAALRAEY